MWPYGIAPIERLTVNVWKFFVWKFADNVGGKTDGLALLHFSKVFLNTKDHYTFHNNDSNYLLTCSCSLSESVLVYLHIGQVKTSSFCSLSPALVRNKPQPPVGRRRGRLRRSLRLGEPGPVSSLGELLPGRGDHFPVL